MLNSPSHTATTPIQPRRLLVDSPGFSTAPPLFLKQLHDIVEEFSRANSPDAAFRAFVLLQTYLSVGRGGEVASSSWTRLKWDFALDNAVNTWGEPKTGKEFPVPMCPHASSQFGDSYWVMGCAAIMGQFNLGGPPRDGESKLLLPQFIGVESGAPKVTRILRVSVLGNGEWVAVPSCQGPQLDQPQHEAWRPPEDARERRAPLEPVRPFRPQPPLVKVGRAAAAAAGVGRACRAKAARIGTTTGLPRRARCLVSLQRRFDCHRLNNLARPPPLSTSPLSLVVSVCLQLYSAL